MTHTLATARLLAVRIFAAIGLVLTTLLIIGIVQDASNFDRTRGGYEPPYVGYTGEPIDWATLDVTANGMAGRGRVINVLVDCTSGMMHFELFGLAIPFREFSPRALAVHKPREACLERGFSPDF
jgi:hypothetical protein